jgi:hypothetical protein
VIPAEALAGIAVARDAAGSQGKIRPVSRTNQAPGKASATALTAFCGIVVEIISRSFSA